MKTATPLRVACALLFAFLAAGCVSVTFKQPVGTPSADGAGKLTGAWLLGPKDEAFVLINAGTDGKVTLAAPEEDGEDFKLNKLKGVVTVLEDKPKTAYLNLYGEEKKDAPPPDRLTIVLVKFDDD